eukprot:COSAG06_NODE_6089_length_3116_cov_3.167716_3_plen_319_part_00
MECHKAMLVLLVLLLLAGGCESSSSSSSSSPRLVFWADGPVNGGCAGWGMPYPGYSAAAKALPSCWNNTLALIAEHAAIIDEIGLSTGFNVDNASKGLINLDVDGKGWAPGFRVRPLDYVPHYIPELLAAVKPGTKILVPFDFNGNATAVASEVYANADGLAKQLVQLATTYDWIDGYILDYEADCGDCPPGPHQGVQNITECLRTRVTCIPREARSLSQLFKTLSTALHAKGKTLGFATNKNGAGFEHWPWYQSYLDAGIDRLYEMGTYSNHSGKDGVQPGDRENVTRQLLNYPLKNTAFGLGDYKSCDNDVSSFPS